MKHIRLIFLAFAFLGAMPSIANAKGAGIVCNNLNQKVKELFRAWKNDRAVVVVLKALEVAEQNIGPDHPNVALSLNNLAAPCKTQGEYSKGQAYA